MGVGANKRLVPPAAIRKPVSALLGACVGRWRVGVQPTLSPCRGTASLLVARAKEGTAYRSGKTAGCSEGRERAGGQGGCRRGVGQRERKGERGRGRERVRERESVCTCERER
eukprot:6195139-Pleurochrysis_carterae.AAC.2